MTQLRPFVSSQRLFQHLLTADADSSMRANTMFRAVCRDVLGTRRACLIPVGSLAPLVGSHLVYPSDEPADWVKVPVSLPESSTKAIIPLNPEEYPDLQWMIPLWSERGRIGVLLLGDKQDGGLYTQEEVEIARSSGERIIDTLAGEQMARRLMELQRGRLAESRVMDRRTRRVLHDEILPTLHTALLRLSPLSKNEPNVREAMNSLTATHQQIADLIHSAHSANVATPTRNLADVLQRLVQDEFADEFNDIRWTVDAKLPALDAVTQEVVTNAAREVIRNAAIHGRGDQPDRPLNLNVSLCSDPALSIVIADDGIGLNTLVQAGANSSPGSGNGLALHTTMLAIVGGSLVTEPSRTGTVVKINLPLVKYEPQPAVL